MARSKPIALPKNPAWLTQILVLRALIARQYKSKFGGYHLGFVWVILEPLTGVFVIGFVVGAIAQRTVPEMPYPFFLLNGYMMMQILTGCMSAGLNGMNAGKAMLVYPSVKPIDPLLARFVFQFMITFTSYVVFCLGSLFFGVRFSISSLDTVVYCYLITWSFSSGIGLVLGVATAYYQELDHIMGFLQRPLIFISAVLFPTSTIPESSREILLWNPLVHTIEQTRFSLYPHYNPTETNLLYPSVFALIALALGLTMFQNNRQFLTSR